MNQAPFYNDIAEYYDLIYADWEESMKRHGAAISQMLCLSRRPKNTSSRILDVSAGIGTQALPLAALGHDVCARDLSAGAITRLKRESEERNLSIDAAQADMRTVSRSVQGLFDAVISFDNSIPHLLTDAEIMDTMQNFVRLLKPGGVILLSVRDYENMDRSPTSVHHYGERLRAGRRFRLRQEWTWLNQTHYRTRMIIESLQKSGWRELIHSEAEYYAVPVSRVLELMDAAGLRSCQVKTVPFFQPVLQGVTG